ncbi:MAG: hypothetical protein LBI36_01800 [Oscillospiraceae bacterium]|jgi:hypothetical protein|nr:hypothetical protein [Oscillospiraceae bacterium]
MKKLTTLLLLFALVFSFAACGGSSTPTAGTPAPTEAPPPPENLNGPGVYSLGGTGEEGTFDFGVLKFTSMDFTVNAFDNFCIGDNVGDEKGRTDARFAIQAPLQQTANLDGEGASRNPDGFIISENGDFWFNIDRIEAKFYLEDKGSEIPTKPEHYGYIQPYLQIGGNPENGTQWEWWSPGQGGVREQVNYAHIGNDPNNDPVPDFGKDNPINVVWDVSAVYEYHGETRGIPGDTSGEEWKAGNGLQKFGVQFGRSDDFFDEKDVDLSLHVGWLEVSIYVKDMEKYNEYVDKCADLGFPADSGVRVAAA